MFSKLKNIFHNKIDTETSEFDTIQIAISTLMIQTAIHDGVFDDSEKNKILELIKKYFGFSEEKKESLFKVAMQASDNSNDTQQFTRILNNNLSEEEKIKIITMLWEIVIADGNIDDYETTLIRKISGLLYVKDIDVGRIKNSLLST